MDLSVAAAQYFHTASLLAFAATLLISAAAFVVMRLYARALLRESRRSGSWAPNDLNTEEAIQRPPAEKAVGSLDIHIDRPNEAIGSPARSPSFQHAEAAFGRAARSYVLGGCVHVASSVGLLFGFGIYSLPSTPSRLTALACCAAIFWAWSFITVLALALFCGPHRRYRWLLFVGYLGMLPAMGIVLELAGVPALAFADVGILTKEEADLVLSFASAVTGQPATPDMVSFSPFLQPLVFWSLAAAPLLLPAFAFNRYVRGTVAPLFITSALLMTVAFLVLLDLVFYTDPGLWFAGRVKRAVGTSAFAVLMVLCLTLSASVACLGLLWIARRYRRRQVSDQTFLFDALWLLVSFCLAVQLMPNDHDHRFLYLLGLLPFVLYKLTVHHGLKRIAARAQTLPNARLLFLRVFGSAKRSEKLFDLLAARWRYAGSIQLISGTDVARSRFEPDEFLDFLGGRLADSYIGSSTDLDRRLAGLPLQPDPDGRYRVNEFFCRVDAWQQTVTTLMARSELVVMDLRHFAPERRGCVFELGALIDALPLQRVALLIDKSTDEPALRRTLADLWQMMDPRSPNANGQPAQLKMVDLGCGYPVAVRLVMRLGDEIMANRDAASLSARGEQRTTEFGGASFQRSCPE